MYVIMSSWRPPFHLVFRSVVIQGLLLELWFTYLHSQWSQWCSLWCSLGSTWGWHRARPSLQCRCSPSGTHWLPDSSSSQTVARGSLWTAGTSWWFLLNTLSQWHKDNIPTIIKLPGQKQAFKLIKIDSAYSTCIGTMYLLFFRNCMMCFSNNYYLRHFSVFFIFQVII